jgi:hypothetical protein
VKGLIVPQKERNELLTPHSSLIGGYFIDNHLCDKLIEFTKNSKRDAGVVYDAGKERIDKKIKDSEDLRLDETSELGKKYVSELGDCLKLYLKKYPHINQIKKFGLYEQINIQYYKKGGGYKDWHCENSFAGTKVQNNRYLVYMTYLNSIADGGTEFALQQLYVPAIKGLTLFWSAWNSHLHRSKVTHTSEKYIVTGWIGFTDILKNGKVTND